MAGLMVNTGSAVTTTGGWSTLLQKVSFDSPSHAVIRSILLQAEPPVCVPEGIKRTPPGRRDLQFAEKPG